MIKMSLVADYSSSSNDSDDSLNDTVPEPKEPIEKLKLPSANLLLGNSAAGKSGEVFSNPYKQAEQAKIALLERHVKMVNSTLHLKEKNGKKICWNYRKGRCRFGSNCSFAHDSDLVVNDSQSEAVKNDNILVPPTISKVQRGLQLSNQTTTEGQTPPSESATAISSKKRIRPGLSDTIVPSKRVLNSYTNQKRHNNNYNQKKLT